MRRRDMRLALLLFVACTYASPAQHRDEPRPRHDVASRPAVDVVPLQPAPQLRDGSTKQTNPRERPEPTWCWDNPQPLHAMDVDLMYQVVQIERGILLDDAAIPGSKAPRTRNGRAAPSYLVAPVAVEGPPNMRSSTTLYPAVADVRDHHIPWARLAWLRVRGFVEDPRTREDTLLLELRVSALYPDPPYFANRGTTTWWLCVVPDGDTLVVSRYLAMES